MQAILLSSTLQFNRRSVHYWCLKTALLNVIESGNGNQPTSENHAR